MNRNRTSVREEGERKVDRNRTSVREEGDRKVDRNRTSGREEGARKVDRKRKSVRKIPNTRRLGRDSQNVAGENVRKLYNFVTDLCKQSPAYSGTVPYTAVRELFPQTPFRFAPRPSARLSPNAHASIDHT